MPVTHICGSHTNYRANRWPRNNCYGCWAGWLCKSVEELTETDRRMLDTYFNAKKSLLKYARKRREDVIINDYVAQ